MSTELVNQEMNTDVMVIPDDIFNPDFGKNDLSGGGVDTYGMLSIRGGRFHNKFMGEETTLLNDDGTPKSSVEVIIVNARGNHSRNYFPGEYVEGESTGPACWSVDGVTPSDDAEDKQAETCAACKLSKWGSAVSKVSGKRITACSSYRRVAVVPAPGFDRDTNQLTDDPSTILNEANGGPMLLRIPGSSLKHLDIMGKALLQKGWSYRAVVLRLSFDPKASYPLLVFKPVRLISEEEKQFVRQVYPASAAVLDVELEAPETATPAPPQVEEEELDEFDANVAVQTEPKATPTPKAKPKPKPKPKAAAKSNGETASLDDTLDSILGELEL